MHMLDWKACHQQPGQSGLPPGEGMARLQMQAESLMNFVINRLANSWLMRKDLDYHILRASMVVIFLFFGYQKWFEYEAKVLIPYISHGPLIFWLYPVFGIRGASWFLGASEWLFGTLLFIGFWNKKLGALGALGSIATFVGTVTIIPFMPNGWEPSAGGFPAMVGNVPFLMKDVVLLAVSIYLLKEDVVRMRDQVTSAANGRSGSDYCPTDTSVVASPLNTRNH
jgi:uncharacterized membrane protein YkgB